MSHWCWLSSRISFWLLFMFSISLLIYHFVSSSFSWLSPHFIFF
jgi:hypothetical protein